MVHFRSFCNFDPPGLVQIWNEALTGRGSVQLRNSSPLERHAYAKLHFDPAGLIVAMHGDEYVGFAHAGFGPNHNETALSYTAGVTCMIAVRPKYRRKGIGSALLERCEAYLRGKGARTLYAGPMKPLNPFYFGLYGGSELPGFLASDEAAGPFLEHHGYRPAETCFVFHKRLEQALNINDGRFASLRRRFHVRVVPRTGVGTWWHESTHGLIEPLEFRLEEIPSGRLAARAEAWEMEGFSWRWGLPSAGVESILVREDLRRQGLGKFLLMHVLRYLQEQYFGLAEVQNSERNQVGIKLLQTTGFEQVDFGRLYRKEKSR